MIQFQSHANKEKHNRLIIVCMRIERQRERDRADRKLRHRRYTIAVTSAAAVSICHLIAAWYVKCLGFCIAAQKYTIMYP